MGRVDRPRGKLKTNDHSLKVIPILQDAPYYARKGTYYSSKNQISKAQIFLQKAIELEPDDPENHLNLACLLSKTGQMEEANLIFKHIIHSMDRDMTECYYYLAANYHLMGEEMEAKYYASKYLHENPLGDMAGDAEEIIFLIEMQEEYRGQGDHSLSPVENETFLKLIRDIKEADFDRRLAKDRGFRRSLHKGLFHGSDVLKEAIIRLLGERHAEKGIDLLLEFVVNPWVKERLRQVALLELKKIGLHKSCLVFEDNIIREVSLQEHKMPAPVWKEEWQEVLECAFSNMKESAHYSDDFFEDARAIWIDFINHSYPKMPRIPNPETWAAGLEYCLARFHFLELTQKDLAENYKVSEASISRIFWRLNRTLGIERKAYQNMLSLLSGDDEEDED